MRHQIPLDSSNIVGTEQPDGTIEVAPDLAYKRLLLVNVVFYGDPSVPNNPWVLIDAGIMGSSSFIQSAARSRFGESNPPAAIILTHGHFDHVGALADLAELWDVPIFAHDLELPYLTGRESYPAPDPSVGGGLMSAFASLYPRGPINVRRWLQPLPEDRTVPFMPGFRWIATPGHSPGHVSFYREGDRSLIAGDAFITTNQESVYAVLEQTPELHGPPMYYNPRLGIRPPVRRQARRPIPRVDHPRPRPRHARSRSRRRPTGTRHQLRHHRRPRPRPLRRRPRPNPRRRRYRLNPIRVAAILPLAPLQRTSAS
jgi:glyoxylase-like metal-dependent hydrolase (beta-lactamase superfamily II)